MQAKTPSLKKIKATTKKPNKTLQEFVPKTTARLQ